MHHMSFLTVFLLFSLTLYGLPELTVVLFPLVVLPAFLFALGVAYVVSSVAVFLHDIQRGVPLLMTALLFLSPVFFPLAAGPKQFRRW